jgi:hypothetical protein
MMTHKYSEGFVAIATKEGKGIVHTSVLVPTFGEAKDRAYEYARDNPDDVVMICKPVAEVNAIAEVIRFDKIDGEPPVEEKDRQPEPA